MMATTNHPESGRLVRYARGQLPTGEMNAVGDHVKDCHACGQAVEAVPEDAFLASLRSTGRSALRPGRARAGRFKVPEALANHTKFDVHRRLAEGGMGVIFLGWERFLERKVALKMIRAELIESRDTVDRFRQELAAVGRLSHESIVTAFGVEPLGDTLLLVMEFIEGRSLDRVVERYGPLASDLACDYMHQAVLGLQHAHERNLVHRDIKPHNLMVTPDGRVKVLDFGLAVLREDARGARLTRSGDVAGSLDYIAPEQARSLKQADVRSDIYGAGCTLYHLLAGRPPFPGGSEIEKLAAHLDREPEPLGALRSDLPPGLEEVVRRMMAKDPDRRYQTPAEVAAALAPFAKLAGTPEIGGAPVEVATGVEAAPPSSWRRVGVALAALLLFAVAGAARWAGLLPIEAQDPGERRDFPSGKPNKPGPVEPPVDDAVKLDGLPTIEFLGHAKGTILTQAISPDGSLVITGSARHGLTPQSPPADGIIFVWNARTGEKERQFAVQDSVWGLAFLDGRYILSAHEDGSVAVWDLQGWGPPRLLHGHVGAVRGVAALGDGRRAVTYGVIDGKVLVWDVKAGKVEHAFLSPEPVMMSCLAVSGDGRVALTGDSKGRIRIYDLVKRDRPRVLDGHKGQVQDVAVLRAGGRALSISGLRANDGLPDEVLRLTNLSTGLEVDQVVIPSHPTCVAVSPRGDRALVGCFDGSVRYFDLDTLRELGQGPRHELWTSDVAFDPNGTFALSAGLDGVVRLLRLPEKKARIRGRGIGPEGR